MTKKWIPSDLKEEALHKMLGLSEDKKNTYEFAGKNTCGKYRRQD